MQESNVSDPTLTEAQQAFLDKQIEVAEKVAARSFTPDDPICFDGPEGSGYVDPKILTGNPPPDGRAIAFSIFYELGDILAGVQFDERRMQAGMYSVWNEVNRLAIDAGVAPAIYPAEVLGAWHLDDKDWLGQPLAEGDPKRMGWLFRVMVRTSIKPMAATIDSAA